MIRHVTFGYLVSWWALVISRKRCKIEIEDLKYVACRTALKAFAVTSVRWQLVTWKQDSSYCEISAEASRWHISQKSHYSCRHVALVHRRWLKFVARRCILLHQPYCGHRWTKLFGPKVNEVYHSETTSSAQIMLWHCMKTKNVLTI